MITTAQRLATLLEDVMGAPMPVRLRAWDGTESGPPGAPVVIIRSRRTLRRLLWQPGELGLAEAYIAGDLDIEGDLGDGLRTLWQNPQADPRPGAAQLATAALTAARLGALGPRPPAPAGRAAAGCSPHHHPRPRGHQPPLRLVQRVLRAPARSVDGVLLRLLGT